MSPDEYIALSMKSANLDIKFFTSETISRDLVHAGLGLITEAGEYADVLKKAMIYGKEPDLVNLDEEVGDLLWYIALHCYARNVTFEYLMEMNIAKLQKRFPDKFTPEQAINRDVGAERHILEVYAKFDQMKATRQFINQFGVRPTSGDAIRDDDGNIWVWTIVDGVGTWKLEEHS